MFCLDLSKKFNICICAFINVYRFQILTLENDIEPLDPLLEVDVVPGLGVEVFVDSVHDHVLRHLQVLVQELPEPLPVNLAAVVVAFLQYSYRFYTTRHR